MQWLGIVPQRQIALLCAAALVMWTACVSTGISAEEAPETYLLRYRFQVGAPVHYTVTNRSEIELQQGEAEQQVEHQEVTAKHYEVLSTDADGNGILQLTIDRVRMSASVDGVEPIKFDSDKDENPPAQFVGVADTVGQPHVKIEASPTGELLSVEWLVKGEQDALPTEEDAGNLDILVRLPEQAVAIGEEWKERFETKVAVNEKLKKNVDMLRTYRLVSVEDQRAKIELKTSIITLLRDPAQEAQLIQKALTGTIEFDLDRGVLLSRSTNLDKTVVGFNGAKSRIRNITSRTERIREEGANGTDHQAVQAAQGTADQPQ